MSCSLSTEILQNQILDGSMISVYVADYAWAASTAGAVLTILIKVVIKKYPAEILLDTIKRARYQNRVKRVKTRKQAKEFDSKRLRLVHCTGFVKRIISELTENLYFEKQYKLQTCLLLLKYSTLVFTKSLLFCSITTYPYNLVKIEK